MPGDLTSIRKILEAKLEAATPADAPAITEALLKVERENGVHGDYEALFNRVAEIENRIAATETHLGTARPVDRRDVYKQARRLG
jgi:hypothetical protein